MLRLEYIICGEKQARQGTGAREIEDSLRLSQKIMSKDSKRGSSSVVVPTQQNVSRASSFVVVPTQKNVPSSAP